MRERQRDYELLVILSPLRASDEEVNAAVGRISQTLNSLGGEVVSSESGAPWGRRKLAYPIRRYSEGEASRRSFTEGFYVLINFRLPTTQIDEFERQLKLNDAVIRHLITSVDQRGQQAPAASTSAFESVAADGDDDEVEDEEKAVRERY